MTVMGRLLFALVLVVALGVAPGGGSSAAAEAVHHPHVAGTGFVYDSPAASTTASANARAAASRGYDVSRNISWAHTRFSDRDLATKGADEAFHYTARQAVQSIEKEGLRRGSYAAPRGDLSPLQAQIDLRCLRTEGFGMP